MFRNVLNDYLRKAFDYLKIENDEQTENGDDDLRGVANTTTSGQESSSTSLLNSQLNPHTRKDLNNNNLANRIREQRQQQQLSQQQQQPTYYLFGRRNRTATTTSASLLFDSPPSSHFYSRSSSTQKPKQQPTLIDEFDWFRPFRQPNDDKDPNDDDNDEPLASLNRRHHPDIKFESYYDYLTKFYTTNTNMSNQARTLDEYFAG